MGDGTWSSWALALAQPLVNRVMAALGLSVVTLTGFNSVFETFSQYISNSWGLFPVAIISLFQFAGIGKAFSIIGSALTTRIFINSLTRSVAFVSRIPG